MKIKIETTIELSANDEKSLRRYFSEMRFDDETFRDWYKSTFIACGYQFMDEKILDYGEFV